MKKHTQTEAIGFDQEFVVGDEVFWVAIDAEAEFDGDGEPVETSIEITSIKVEGDNGPIPFEIVSNFGDEVVIEGNPELAKAINDALWQSAVDYGNDNWEDLRDDIEDYVASRGN